MNIIDASKHIVYEDISTRGRLIAQMDRVSWVATDVVFALKPKRDLLGLYVTHLENDQWRVPFGRLSSDETVFLTAYEAIGSTPEGPPFEVKVHDPPHEDRDRLLALSRSISRSRKVFPFHPQSESYIYAAVPEEDGSISVFWYPGTTNPNIEVLGADGVVTVNASGETNVIRYHKSLMVHPRNRSDSMESHTHLLIEHPVPMDVAYVLMRRPPSRSMIMSEEGMYLIHTDGSIVKIPVTRG
jgi:hypothetical protein